MPEERHYHHHQKSQAGQPHFSPWENHAVSPLRAICGHTEKKKAIGSNQCEFTKDKTSLNNLIAFYDKMTGFMNEGRAVDVIYLCFIKAFDIMSPTASLYPSCDVRV